MHIARTNYIDGGTSGDSYTKQVEIQTSELAQVLGGLYLQTV
jgi:hypothetical protein